MSEPTCRICFEPADKDNKLINPAYAPEQVNLYMKNACNNGEILQI